MGEVLVQVRINSAGRTFCVIGLDCALAAKRSRFAQEAVIPSKGFVTTDLTDSSCLVT